jgi:hypothetical protein
LVVVAAVVTAIPRRHRARTIITPLLITLRRGVPSETILFILAAVPVIPTTATTTTTHIIAPIVVATIIITVVIHLLPSRGDLDGLANILSHRGQQEWPRGANGVDLRVAKIKQSLLL